MHELTAVYSPESNGKAELLNRILMELARCMMMDITTVRGQEHLWAEAKNTANHLRSRIFSSASNETGKTPYEIIMAKKLNLKYVRKFGSKAFVHIPKQKRH